MVDVYLSTRWEGETNERHANRVVGAVVVVVVVMVVMVMLQCWARAGDLLPPPQRKIHALEKASE